MSITKSKTDLMKKLLELDPIEIEPVNSDEFLKIKETLTRIGIPCRTKGVDRPVLWQSCHLLHKQGRYFIVHFKQLFLLDGKTERTVFDDVDFERTEYIANLLSKWGLVKLKTHIDEFEAPIQVVIIPFKEKNKWDLKSKYTIGSKHEFFGGNK